MRYVRNKSGLLVPPCFCRGGISPFTNPQILRPIGGGGGGSSTCPGDGSPDISVPATDDDEDSVSQTTDRIYVGQKAFSHALGVAKDVCKIGFYMNVGAGTVSTKKYRASIWSVSGDNLGSLLTNGISDEMSGPSAEGWIRFPWSGSKPSLASGTSYHIAVAAYTAATTTLAAADNVNRAVVWADTPSSINGSKAVWSNVGVIDVDSTTYDVTMEIYWYD